MNVCPESQLLFYSVLRKIENNGEIIRHVTAETSQELLLLIVAVIVASRVEEVRKCSLGNWRMVLFRF